MSVDICALHSDERVSCGSDTGHFTERMKVVACVILVIQETAAES